MSGLSAFHFLRPEWLLLAPLAIGLWWLVRRLRDPLRAWRSVMDDQLLEAMTVGQDNGARIRDYLLLSAWILAIVALAGPTWKVEPSPFADDPVPVMLVLRANESMDLEDMTPSRMERARLKAVDFANARKGQPLGLVAYAGTPHLVLPPTRDTSVVGTMAEQISPAIMPKPGDDLLGALNLAIEAMGETPGSIVIVADSVANVSTPQLAAWRQEHPIPLYFLAIARPETPELEAIERAAKSLGARVTSLTPDDTDIETLVARTARAPIAVSAADDGVRWQEAGWWLTPLLALLSLVAFQRREN